MRRLLRWAFNFAGAMSAALLVATCVLWARSYFAAEVVCWVQGVPRRYASPPPYEMVSGYWPEVVALAYGAGINRGQIMLFEMALPVGTDTGFNRITGRNGEPLLSHGSKWGFDLKRGDPADWLPKVRGSGQIGVDLDAVPRVAVPMWLISVGFGIAPALWLRSQLSRHRRLLPGICPSCKYDLRATPLRCPECGAIPVRSRRSKE